MISDSILSLVNAADNNLVLRIRHFEDDSPFNTIQRQSVSSIILLREGKCSLKVDFSEYEASEKMMLFFSPYQPFSLEAPEGIRGVCIDFHPEFFCLLKHQKEIAFCGLIFNNIYDPPFISISDTEAVLFDTLIAQLIDEVQKKELAQHELLVSILKIFMIHASRIRMQQRVSPEISVPDEDQPFILQNLKDAIDAHFREKHSASEYAEALNISPKALAKITKTYLNKTLTDLITERIVLEAKRDLYTTAKSVKEIAYDLGFKDEYHFSRYFRNSTSVSPQIYRNNLKASKAIQA
jgi:AraC family transcriptional regulator, transcriptional activator of pobA